METHITKFISFLIIFNTSYFCYSQEHHEQNKSYSFNVVLDMNHLSRKNDHNYRFLINKGWDFDDNGVIKFLDFKTLYFITYKYKKAFDKGFDHYDRIPKDTLKINLSDYQLDSIFVLTTELMTIDNNLNVIDNNIPKDDYDGKYASVKLELNEYSIINEIMISFDTQHIFQNRFNKLLEFLICIKDNQ